MRIYIKEFESAKLLTSVAVDSVGNINVGDYVQIYNPKDYAEGNYLAVVQEVKHLFKADGIYPQEDIYEMTIYVTLQDKLKNA